MSLTKRKTDEHPIRRGSDNSHDLRIQTQRLPSMTSVRDVLTRPLYLILQVRNGAFGLPRQDFHEDLGEPGISDRCGWNGIVHLELLCVSLVE